MPELQHPLSADVTGQGIKHLVTWSRSTKTSRPTVRKSQTVPRGTE